MLTKIKNNYFILISTVLFLYFFFNLLDGERGLISYFEKKKMLKQLEIKESVLNTELQDLKHKIKLIKNNDLDYLDMLYREKLKYGTKGEILIKLK